jgi:hypothetical protein
MLNQAIVKYENELKATKADNRFTDKRIDVGMRRFVFMLINICSYYGAFKHKKNLR